MASNKQYHFKLDLHNIKEKNNKRGCYDWKNSVGCKIPFTSDVLSGELTILEYIPKSKSVSNNVSLKIKYQNIIDVINIGCIKRGALGGFFKDLLFIWEYEIGQRIKDEKRDITIIDRKYENGRQYYKIKCNKCGFNSTNHYSIVDNKYKKEYWVLYTTLRNGSGCPCCATSPKIVVKGINDIATTNPWMVKFFKNKEDCFRYTFRSSSVVEMICPDCNENTKCRISNLYKRKYVPCKCRDTISMPNKIAYYTLKSINIISNYNNEYSPIWARPYRYDNYFEYNDKKYIIEMDGGVGHGKRQYKSYKNDVDGLNRDLIKDNLAKEYDVILLRIDCDKLSDLEIFNKLKTTLEYKVFDKQINLCTEDILFKSSTNMVRNVCDYYNNISQNIKLISEKFNIAQSTVVKYLHKGTHFNMCKYYTFYDAKNENLNTVKSILDKNPYYTTNELASILECSQSTVCNYLKQLEIKDTEDVKQYKMQKQIKNMTKATSKKVYVYDKNKNYIAEYISQNDLERKSIDDFGIELKSRCVSRVCTGERKQYKGYIFSFNKLN